VRNSTRFKRFLGIVKEIPKTDRNMVEKLPVQNSNQHLQTQPSMHNYDLNKNTIAPSMATISTIRYNNDAPSPNFAKNFSNNQQTNNINNAELNTNRYSHQNSSHDNITFNNNSLFSNQNNNSGSSFAHNQQNSQFLNNNNSKTNSNHHLVNKLAAKTHRYQSGN
jgi:hypothetical protein